MLIIPASRNSDSRSSAKKTKPSAENYQIAFILALILLGFWRVYLFRGFLSDENFWIQSIFQTEDLPGFLETGFFQLKRHLYGAICYFYLLPFKYTDSAYAVWATIKLSIIMGASAAMMAFLKRISPGDSALPFAGAAIFAFGNLDLVQAMGANFIYPLAVLLSIVSFNLTIDAVKSEKTKSNLTAAVFLAATVQFALMESAIAFELARLAFILYFLRQKGFTHKKLFWKGALMWLPFLLISLSLVFFKLQYPTDGVYKGHYDIALDSFFEMSVYKSLIGSLGFLSWHFVLKQADYIANVSWLEPLVAILICGIAYKARFFDGLIAPGRPQGLLESFKKYSLPLTISILLTVPTALMYILTGRVPYPYHGFTTRHAEALRWGHAMFFGGAFCVFLSIAGPRVFLRKLLLAALCIFICLGVFVSNVNLDAQLSVFPEQSKFWNAFMARFPAMPETDGFFFDINTDEGRYNKLNFTQYGEFELLMNLLYSDDTSPGGFRKYRIFLYQEDRFKDMGLSGALPFERLSFWGLDSFTPSRMTFVRYEDGALLVNDEIIRYYPDAPYAGWIGENKFPDLPAPEGGYPFRNRVPWLSSE